MRSAHLLYRIVLSLYPKRFRTNVGPELFAAFKRGLDDNETGRISFLAKELGDLLLNLPAEWWGRRPWLRRAQPYSARSYQRAPRLFPPLVTDFRIAIRGFLRRPGFASAAILTFALGIGANTAVFALLHTILFDPLPFRDVDRLALIEGNHMVGHANEGATVYPRMREWPGLERAFSGISEFGSDVRFLLDGGDVPERVQGALVSANFLEVVGVDPVLGRGFLPAEEGLGAPDVVLLSESLWRGRLGADPNIIGNSISIAGEPHVVVGVLPDHFRFPLGSVIWVPTEWGEGTLRHLEAVGRLAPGVSLSLGITSLRDAVESMGGRGDRENIGAVSLRDWIFGGQKAPVFIFYTVVSLVLAVACLNVASLFLARNETRRHELAVRASLGASRARLVREMVTESLLLAAIGGALGIAVGWFGRDLILAALPNDIPPYFTFEIPAHVLLTLGSIVLASGVFFGLVPALAARSSDLQGMLAAGSRSLSAGKPRRRLWSSLVATEIALALTVLICANLLVKSLVHQIGAEKGFDATNLVTVEASPDFWGEPLWEYYARVTEEISATAGFTAVGLCQWLDTGENYHWWSAYVEELGEVRDVRYQRTDPGYFAAMGIPLLGGRNFNNHDTYKSPRVLMVNETFAERYWPGENPVGKRLGRGSVPPSEQDWHEVVALVADVHNAGFGRAAEPQVYLPYNQSGLSELNVIARTTLETSTALRSLRQTIRSIDPTVPQVNSSTMEQAIRQANWQVPFATWAFGLLSIIALVLAATGVYGLVTFTVTQRSRDLAIRVAVGANSGVLQRMVVRESLVLAISGVLAGVIVAAVGMRLVVSLLFLVGPRDLTVYLLSVAVMTTTVVLASYGPARRIVRLDPMTVLGRE